MIYLSKPYFGEEELLAVSQTFKSGWVAGQGPKNMELAETIKKYLSVKYAIPVNNCTAGLHLALLALDIKEGDEVIVSDYTFPATGHAVKFCGATPRFVDVDKKTYNIKPELIEKKINKKTKAIIVVHALGQAADMDPIMEIAKKHKLKVIEDAACALGAKYKDKNVGTIGDIAAFSFHARKNITSGEGGIVVTNNEKYAQIISSLSCFGMESAYKRQSSFKIPSFEKLGYNYKLSDINAAIVLEQLKRYPKILAKKRELVEKYRTLLADCKYITLPYESPDSLHVYQTFAVVLDKKIDRNKIIVNLLSEGIQTQIGTYSSFLQPVYNSKDFCPNSQFLFEQSLALPLYYQLEISEIEIVVKKLMENIKKQLET